MFPPTWVLSSKRRFWLTLQCCNILTSSFMLPMQSSLTPKITLMCRRIWDFFCICLNAVGFVPWWRDALFQCVCIVKASPPLPGRVCSMRTPTETQLPNTAMASIPQSSCLFESCRIWATKGRSWRLESRRTRQQLLLYQSLSVKSLSCTWGKT